MKNRRLNLVRTGAAVCLMLAVCAGLHIQPVEAQPGGSSVVIDTFDKQNLTGQTTIALAWGQHFDVPQNLVRGVINLREAMNRWTNIQTSMDRHLLLSDQRILSAPFVFVTADNTFELTETERKNVQAYFQNGGFMFLDNASPVSEFSASGASLKQMLRETIPNARFEPIPITDDIYHSFFDFPDGPPRGAEVGTMVDSDRGLVVSRERFYLEGVRYRGRLVAVYSDKGYITKWAQASENEPQLRMGVNLVVHALTQEGSIANQGLR